MQHLVLCLSKVELIEVTMEELIELNKESLMMIITLNCYSYNLVVDNLFDSLIA